MCDPVSIAVVSGTVAAGGALYTAKVASDEARSSAEWQERQAAVEHMKTSYDIAQERRRTAAILGTQMAGFSAAGVDASSGTPLDVQTDTIKQQEMNVQARRIAGEENVDRLQFGAATARTRGRNALISGGINAVGAGLGAYNTYLQGQPGTSMAPTAFQVGTRGATQAAPSVVTAPPVQLPGLSDPNRFRGF